MNHIRAIFRKQLNDTLKNKTVLIQFLMFPFLTIVMNNAIQIEDMPQNYFIYLFATMYIGMSPLTSMAAIISEEKEKNTLRVLLMSNVLPYEYLLGVGSYVWFACMAGSGMICATAHFNLQEGFIFMMIMAIGILVSILVGATIGIWSKTQMMATSLSLPVMMVLSFVPMLSLFNTTISKVGKYIYSQQINVMLLQVTQFQLDIESVLIVVVNMVVAVFLFVVAYKKSRLA